MNVRSAPLTASYTKPNGTFVLRTEDIELTDDFHIYEQAFICIPPGEFGGSHKHPRKEIFIGMHESLELVWLSEKGDKHVERMFDGRSLRMFYIPPNVPHAVVNRSNNSAAFLYEIADAKQHNVEQIDLVTGL